MNDNCTISVFSLTTSKPIDLSPAVTIFRNIIQKLCSCLMLMFLMNGLTYSQASWIRVTSPVNTNLTSVSFSNTRTGFITSGNKILKTTNGGFDWIVFDSSFTYALDKIQFVNQSTGYVVSPDAARIYKTTDLATTWNDIGLGKTFCFVDEIHGWSNYYGYMGIQYTIDGGASWNTCSGYGQSSNVFFGSPNFGVTTGYFHDFMRGWVYMYIYRSTDGVNFNCVPGGVIGDPCAWSKTPGGIGGTPPNELFNKVYLIDGTAGFLYYGYIKSNIYRTIDAGLSWSGPIGIGTSAANFDFINHNTGYGAGTGTIIYTTNCGSTWSNQNVGVTSQINDIYMFDNTMGWACGDAGVILLSGVNPPVIPEPPWLLSPADSSAGMPLIDTLIWERSVDGIYYQLQVAVDLGFNNIIVNDSGLMATSRIITGLLPFTTYYWRVNTRNSAGTSNWSSVWRFKTKGYPALINLAVPPNNAVNILLNCTFYWTKAFDQQLKPTIKEKHNPVLFLGDESETIEKYWFELTTDTITFSNILLDSTLTDTSRNVINLINSTAYFWRVKAKNEIGWGAFSNWWKFTTITAAPPTPVPVSPANGSTGLNLSLPLVWNKLPSADSYRLQVANDSLFTSLIVNDSNIIDSTRIISGLSPLTYYWWRVNAKNIGGTSGYSTVFKFKTIGSPTQPILNYPPNNAVNQLTNLTCIWGRSVDMLAPWLNVTKKSKDEIESISSYWFDMVTDTVSMSNLLRDTTLTDTSKAISGLNYLTSYFWRVKAKNQIGWGNFSLWFKFITMPPPPALVNLIVIPGGLFNTGINQLNKKDTIIVYLLDSVNCLKIDSSRGVLDSVNFSMPLTFSYAATGSYYMVVTHRNHLSVATRFTQGIVRGSSVSYNFTSDSAMAFGFNMIKVSTSPERWGMIPGDANTDGFIDAIDQFTWGMQNGLDGYLTADFNGDGFVDAIDQSIWIIFNGLSSYLPCGFTSSPGTQIPIKNIPDFDVKNSKNFVPVINNDNGIKKYNEPDKKNK
jgi:hypothetical protein